MSAHPKKIRTSLVALSSAAVLTVYTAGYMRTRAAAEKFADERFRRRPSPPAALVEPEPGSSGPATSAAVSAPAAIAPQSREAMAAPAVVVVRPSVEPARSGEPSATQPVHEAAAPVAATVTKGEAPDAAPAPASTPAPLGASASPMPLALASTSQILASLPTVAPKPLYQDGTYTGWGTCRHGDIQAKVVITAGKIESATIAQCLTRYSCSWISPLPPQVVKRQSPETDYVSGATDSTNAFYYAVVEALKLAKTK